MSGHSQSSSSRSVEAKDIPFSRRFFDSNNTNSRNIYFRKFFGGCFLVVIGIFSVLSIYWGALWKTPVRNLRGWVVDFDQGLVGQTVTRGLISTSSRITWTAVNASKFSGDPNQVGDAVIQEKTWVAVTSIIPSSWLHFSDDRKYTVNVGATARLRSSFVSPNTSYNGSDAITVYADEARNENAYRNMIRPSFEVSLGEISQSFALQSANQLASSNLTSLLSISPQTVVTPIWYTINNLVPFNVPVASAVTFVGLIYQLILSFFIVMIGYSARDVSNLDRYLTLRSLLMTRFVSSFGAYFLVALFYSLLSLAFQVDFSHRYGTSGFVIFWMLNWVGMLSVGLALEALITILTTSFIPFFMLLWIIVNVSVCVLPIEVLPAIYRYGYAMPFYNVSRAIRSIVFGTKNSLGLNFGVLIAWTAISCITLTVIQWLVRRSAVIAGNQTHEVSAPVVVEGEGEEREV